MITAVLAMILLATTVYLSREARTKEEEGFTGYIVGLNSVIYLREEPEPASHIVTILELGQQVFITGEVDSHGLSWYQVRAGDNEGWILADRIGVDPP
jgi:hypothetical protein